MEIGFMIIHQHIPKRKAKKPNAKQRELKSSWQDILKKYETKPTNTNKKQLPKTNVRSVIISDSRIVSHIPSKETGIGIAVKKNSPVYTGDAMIGIGQLHKSNAVPIFQAADAIDISKMRRG
jgi:hypothetical protein